MKRIEVCFTPAEFQTLKDRDLGETVCVVFDILRATSTIVTALANKAEQVIPVSTLEEALALKALHPEFLLAGERDGFRIGAELTGGVEFDFGNSPREFTPEKVQGQTIIMTTTNGSRALRACVGAKRVLAGSFLNLAATAKVCGESDHILIVCSGTYEESSLEDTLAAGALVDLLEFSDEETTDSAHIARQVYVQARTNLLEFINLARNGRRLLGIPELKDDVRFCLRRNCCPDLLAEMSNGAVRGIELRGQTPDSETAFRRR